MNNRLNLKFLFIMALSVVNFVPEKSLAYQDTPIQDVALNQKIQIFITQCSEDIKNAAGNVEALKKVIQKNFDISSACKAMLRSKKTTPGEEKIYQNYYAYQIAQFLHNHLKRVDVQQPVQVGNVSLGSGSSIPLYKVNIAIPMKDGKESLCLMVEQSGGRFFLQDVRFDKIRYVHFQNRANRKNWQEFVEKAKNYAKTFPE